MRLLRHDLRACGKSLRGDRCIAAAKAGRSFCSLFGMTKGHALLQSAPQERFSASCAVVPFHKTLASSSFSAACKVVSSYKASPRSAFQQAVKSCPFTSCLCNQFWLQFRIEAALYLLLCSGVCRSKGCVISRSLSGHRIGRYRKKVWMGVPNFGGDPL
jgi:hypothetical protein